MKYSSQVWDQLKNITADELISALNKDGWTCDTKGGSMHIFLHPDKRRVSIHYHPQKTYGKNLLKGLLTDIGWSEQRLKELKVIK